MSEVGREYRAIAKDAKRENASRVAGGRSVNGGALAPRKVGGEGRAVLGKTPKGRDRVKITGKPLGGSLPRAILRGRVRMRRRGSGYIITYDGRDGVALRMFHFGVPGRQEPRPVLGQTRAQLRQSRRRIMRAVKADLRGKGLAR